jgi:hypothetical protein
MGLLPNLQERPKQAARQSGSVKGEELAESVLAIAQHIWSRGNLSPLDTMLGSLAVVNLIPAKGFGFIGHHLGQRLRKYAEDSKADVEAAEVDSTLTRAHLKAKSPIRLYPWKPEAPVFKKGRYMAFIALQPSTLRGGIKAVYGQAAAGLKPGGKLFAADLMLTGSDPDRVKRICGNFLGGMAIASCQDHVTGLNAASVRVENKYDLTHQFLSSVRIGLQNSLGMLEGLSLLSEPDRVQRTGAFAAQLATWKSLYDLAEAQKIVVVGLLAVKGSGPAQIQGQSGDNQPSIAE